MNEVLIDALVRELCMKTLKFIGLRLWERMYDWYFLFVMTWRKIYMRPGLVSRPIKFL